MRKFDYIIVGSGLAGLYAAWKASLKGSVAVITKSFVRESNSFNAQGCNRAYDRVSLSR